MLITCPCLAGALGATCRYSALYLHNNFGSRSALGSHIVLLTTVLKADPDCDSLTIRSTCQPSFNDTGSYPTPPRPWKPSSMQPEAVWPPSLPSCVTSCGAAADGWSLNCAVARRLELGVIFTEIIRDEDTFAECRSVRRAWFTLPRATRAPVAAKPHLHGRLPPPTSWPVLCTRGLAAIWGCHARCVAAPTARGDQGHLYLNEEVN